MSELPRFECDFSQAKVVDWGSVTLLEDHSRESVGLRAKTILGPDRPISGTDDTLKAEAETLFFLNDKHIPTPRLLGLGEVRGLKEALKELGSNNPYIIKNGFPFYAREWIYGKRVSGSSVDVLKTHGDTLIGFAIDFGAMLEKSNLSYFPHSRNFILSGDKIVFVGPLAVKKRLVNANDLYEILWGFLPEKGGLPYSLRDIQDTSPFKPALREVLEDMKSGRIKSFADLRGHVLDYVFPEIAGSLGYAKDPRTGLYRPKSEIPQRGQEAFGLTEGVKVVEEPRHQPTTTPRETDPIRLFIRTVMGEDPERYDITYRAVMKEDLWKERGARRITFKDYREFKDYVSTLTPRELAEMKKWGRTEGQNRYATLAVTVKGGFWSKVGSDPELGKRMYQTGLYQKIRTGQWEPPQVEQPVAAPQPPPEQNPEIPEELPVETYTLPERKTQKPHVNRRNRTKILNLLGEMYNNPELGCLGGIALSIKTAIEQGKDPGDAYNDTWKTILDVYPDLTPSERKVSTYLERLDILFSLSPSFVERTTEFIVNYNPIRWAEKLSPYLKKVVSEKSRASELLLNGKYSPARFAKQHPSVVAAGAGLLVSESFSRDMNPLLRLESDLLLSLGAAMLTYVVATIRSKDYDKRLRNSRKVEYLVVPTMVSAIAVLLTAANSAKYDQPPPNAVQPKQESVATPVQKESPTVVPMQTQDNLKYLGDKFTTSSISSPRTGARCTVDNIGYDFSANPTLILGCSGSKILLGYSVGGRDQFSKIYQKLKGKEIEITRQPFGTYEGGFVYSADTIKVGNQTLLEYLK